MNDKLEKLVNKVWNYHLLNQKLEKSDCIIVLGSCDTRVAERGAQLFLDGWAPIILFSGGLGRLTADKWNESEAEKFSKIAMGMGVPRDKILIENKSTNSGENIEFSRTLLETNNIDPNKIIVVQKPYMERRAYATFKKRWPEPEIIVTSSQLSFNEYLTDEFNEEYVINIIVGDLQRIKLYPDLGFQIFQEIPNDVVEAYEELVSMGYTKQLVKS